MKNKKGLIKKYITDKNGKRTTVWVKNETPIKTEATKKEESKPKSTTTPKKKSIVEMTREERMEAKKESGKKLDAITNDYRKGKYKSYEAYLKAWKSEKSNYDKYRKGANITDLIKHWGAKVTKNKQWAGYNYEGKNFTAVITQDCVETCWWEVNVFADGTPEVVFERYYDNDNTFDTKKDVLASLLYFDKELSGEKS